jgi:hypothetical protein
MACMEQNTCLTDQIFHRINCNFNISYIHYICNPLKTCKRTDGLYDCCSSNIADCIVDIFVYKLSPTIAPTMEVYSKSKCDELCNISPSSNKCYWFEIQNLDNSCIDKNNHYCCSHIRAECCHTSVTHAFIAICSVFVLFLSCILYKMNLFKRTQIAPDKYTSNVLHI